MPKPNNRDRAAKRRPLRRTFSVASYGPDLARRAEEITRSMSREDRYKALGKMASDASSVFEQASISTVSVGLEDLHYIMAAQLIDHADLDQQVRFEPLTEDDCTTQNQRAILQHVGIDVVGFRDHTIGEESVGLVHSLSVYKETVSHAYLRRIEEQFAYLPVEFSHILQVD